MEKSSKTPENEIRVTSKGFLQGYVRYGIRILTRAEEHKSLTIKATGQAITNGLILVEILKRRVGELH